MSYLKRLLTAAFCVSAILGFSAAGPAVAQSEWKPSRNVEMLVGTGAGGTVDLLARVVQRALEAQNLAPSVSVVNLPGAGYQAALQETARRAGDGHYLAILGTSWITTAVQTKRLQNMDAATPVAKLFESLQVMAVRADSPLKTAPDMIAALKKDPASISFAISTTAGNSNHLGVLRLGEIAGIDVSKMRIVVNNSGSLSLTQLLGGHIDVCNCGLNHSKSLGAEGRLLGLAADKRWEGAPDIPTLKEQGVDMTISSPIIIATAKDATPEQVAYWDKALTQILQSPEVRKAAADNLFAIDHVTGKDLTDYLKREVDSVQAKLQMLGLIAN